MTTSTTTPEHPRHSRRTPGRALRTTSIALCSVALAATGVTVGLTVAGATETHTHHVHVVDGLSVQAVRNLQKELSSLNYYGGPIDGIYGPQTEAAVTYLQRDAGLAQTGTMNDSTRSALQWFLANGNSQMNPHHTQAETVKRLQKELASLNYYDGPIDGTFGPQTRAAVEYLQRDAGLPPTGTMNTSTKTALQWYLVHGNSQMNPGPLSSATTVVATQA